MKKLTESDVKLEINQILSSNNWKLIGKNKNVFTEVTTPSFGRCDYLLKGKSDNLIVIEVKKKGDDLKLAIEQAKKYAKELNAPICYATDGNIIKTWHNKFKDCLFINGNEVNQFIKEEIAIKFVDNNHLDILEKKIIKSRKELIKLFSSVNELLRKTGLQSGAERFSEFSIFLFLKIFSEQEELVENNRISEHCRWKYFRNKNEKELLHYLNNIVLEEFRNIYDKEIFSFLKIQDHYVLKQIIDKLDQLSLTDIKTDIKGDAFEFFLKVYLINQKKDLGEYFTPRHLVKFLVELANPRFGEKIYDPFCGTGGILIESYKHIKKWTPHVLKNSFVLEKETIFGQEITHNLCKTAKMNMILAGNISDNIKKKDSWSNPVGGKYDVVITNMPFGLGSMDIKITSNCQEHSFRKKNIEENCEKCWKNKKEKEFRQQIWNKYNNYYLENLNANSLCLEHCFEAIDKARNGRIYIIVPESILFDKKFINLRKFIYNNSYVEYIISLPVGSFSPYAPNAKSSILCLTNIWQKKEQKDVWFFEVKNDGYTLDRRRKKKEGENDLDIFFNFKDSDEEKKIKNGFKKIKINLIKNNDYISIFNVYRNYIFDNTKFKMISIGELVERTKIFNNENFPIWSLTREKGFIEQNKRFIERIASENIKNYKLVFPNHFAFDPIRISFNSFCFNFSQKIGCVSPIYQIFRIKNEKKIKSNFLNYILQSEKFIKQSQSFSFGTARPALTFSNFCKIKIPVPDIKEQEKYVDEIEKKIQENIDYQKKIDNNKELIKKKCEEFWK